MMGQAKAVGFSKLRVAGTGLPRAGWLPQEIQPHDALPQSASFPVSGVPAAALIETRDGAVPACNLVAGVQVRTRAGGWQIVRAAVAVRHRLSAGSTHPVVLRMKALGHGPTADLGLPGAQRVIIESPRAVQVAGQSCAAVPVTDLLHLDGVRTLALAEDVFVHVLLDRVDAIFAAGLWLETFVPRPAALQALGGEGRRAMIARMPRLAHLAGQAQYVAPWPTLTAREADEVL